jgi:hypothetical protein
MAGNIGYREIGIDIELAGICGQRRAGGEDKTDNEQGQPGYAHFFCRRERLEWVLSLCWRAKDRSTGNAAGGKSATFLLAAGATLAAATLRSAR